MIPEVSHREPFQPAHRPAAAAAERRACTASHPHHGPSSSGCLKQNTQSHFTTYTHPAIFRQKERFEEKEKESIAFWQELL